MKEHSYDCAKNEFGSHTPRRTSVKQVNLLICWKRYDIFDVSVNRLAQLF